MLAEEVDLVTCVWALQHLPDADHLRRCLEGIAAIRRRTGCAVWIFDFARLRRSAMMPALLGLSPTAPARLHDDGVASEAAAWSAQELRDALDAAGLDAVRGGHERVHRHLQSYWAPGRPSGHSEHFIAPTLSARGRLIQQSLRRTLPRP